MSKTQKVLEHLQYCGSITSLEAIENYGATRLSAIIFELKKKGYNITVEMQPFVDKFGNKNKYARYYLNKEINDESGNRTL